MKKYDAIVIGGGASGVMAAIWASKNKSVLLLEKNSKIGKKILVSGNGRCNLTNSCVETSCYHGSDKQFIKNVISNFDQYKTMDFFRKLGVTLKEENNGRIFPKSDQAQSVVDALKNELIKRKVNILLNSNVKKIEHKKRWIVDTDSSIQYTADKLIITTGGKAAHQLGSLGDGYNWVEKLGHNIIPIFPALVPLETKELWVKKIQGIKIRCDAKIIQNNKIIHQKLGDIIFTHFGISGPAIMSQTRFIAPIIDDNIIINLDIFPEENINELDEKFKKIIDENGAKEIKNCLNLLVPSKLATVILKNLNIKDSKKSAETSKEERKKIISTLKNFLLTPVSLRSFSEAQVTRGGVDTKEIDPKTMQSKIVPSLYFAGEVVDVDGDSGGYNLQWAWSSGYVAGTSV